MSDEPNFAGWRMTEETIPERPDDPEWRMRWKTRIKRVALSLAIIAAYMGAYYATVAIDQNGLQKRQTYQILALGIALLVRGVLRAGRLDRQQATPCPLQESSG